MALVDTGNAIGAVSRLLHTRLQEKLNALSLTPVIVEIGKPEKQINSTGVKLNLFLYEAQFDASLKNTSIDEGQQPPLWLVLKYIMTAFHNGESDSDIAHEYLGKGMQALKELSFIPLSSSNFDALKDNPEVLKITFDEINADLLSKLMQGPDEKYRFSVAFQVRPVMIAPRQLSSYPLLVGVNYTNSPPAIIGEDGIIISALPSLGPTITHVSPGRFEVNSAITIFGNDLNLSGLSVMLGSAELAVISLQPNRLQCMVNGNIAAGNVISAGNHPISVVQILPTGRRRSSNILVGNLLPSLESADIVPGTIHNSSLPESPGVYGEIDLTGYLLATEHDDILVALYREGKTVRVLDSAFDFTVPQPPPPSLHTRIRLKMKELDAVPQGIYRVIFRVNGQQARNSPEVNLS